MNYLYRINHLRCSYDKKFVEGLSHVVLEISSLKIPRGKRIFIVGESGIGKSTILETLGMMNNTIVPSNDTFFEFVDKEGTSIDLKELWRKGDRQLANFRLKNYSFIFQSTNLMKNFTVFENIAFTRMIQGYSKFSCFQRTKKVLEDLGLSQIDENRMVQELSGGQQQRLAFARAVLPDFTVLFGDEPTGNLDAKNAIRVMEILTQKMNEHQDATAIIVSHDIHLAVTFADVIIKICKHTHTDDKFGGEYAKYGFIDDKCMYLLGTDGLWSNGSEKFSSPDFELFLQQR